MKDTSDIVIGANGSIMVAPVGTVDPDTIAADWPDGWTDIGFSNEDGVTLIDSKTMETVGVWQLFYPARRFISARDFTAAFVLRQWGGEQVRLAFGGGDITQDDDGLYRYTPPDPSFIDERALGIDWQDGDKHYRVILHRAISSESVETKIARSAASDLPITMAINGADGEVPWVLLTDDPAFADAILSS